MDYLKNVLTCQGNAIRRKGGKQANPRSIFFWT